MTTAVVHCTFHYACPEDWSALTPTRDPAIRFCAVFRRDVHLCHSDEDVKRHAAAGHCVAVPVEQAAGDERALVGMPDPGYLAQQDERDAGTQRQTAPEAGDERE